MKEEFLHYLWKYSLYEKDKLLDSDRNEITVIHPGIYNRDSGPDFFNAKLLIAGTIWAGNVEIHTAASHFDLHGHQHDPAYNNVILHVVAKDDKKVFNSRGEEVLTTEISFSPDLYDRYESLVNNPYIIACQHELGKVDRILTKHWLSSLTIERLEIKTGSVKNLLAETGNDWEETLYIYLSRYFGFRINSEPFEMLANALPFKIIRKHSDNIFQIEALLFGVAGMLEEGLFREALTDEYYINLVKEYKILQAKYSLQTLHGWIWKFSRLRPVNFPTVRISQLAGMLSVTGGLFSRILDADDVSQVKQLFEVSSSSYWEDHFVFGKKSRKVIKKTGSQATDILIINAVIPILFVYGIVRDRQDICDKALRFLENTEAEKNVITAEWEAAGLVAESAFFSQALIQLRNEYCKKRKCLDCRVGNTLISMGIKLKNHDELLLEP